MNIIFVTMFAVVRFDVCDNARNFSKRDSSNKLEKVNRCRVSPSFLTVEKRLITLKILF